MRSLYTDDIAGTRSRLTIFQKGAFTQKYQRFVRSNQKNPQHKKYQWYVPLKKQRGDSVDFKQPRYTLKLMSEHTGLSRSGHFDQLKKVSQTQLNQLNQSKVENSSSILSYSGRNSMGIDNNPYFPHKYEDYNSNKMKFSGNRNWNYVKPQKLQLPNITKSKLISYI